MRVLPDTSIWVSYLRRGRRRNGPSHHLDQLLSAGSVVLCGPVLAEILAGTNPETRLSIWSRLELLDDVDLDRAAYRLVGDVSGELRRNGLSLPLTDISIAVASTLAGAALWTKDDDFRRIRNVLPSLELYEPGADAS